MSRFLISCMVAMGLTAMVAPSQAQWTSTQRAEFLGDCNQSCAANPKVHPSRRSDCPAYCDCVADEGERQFSAADYTQMDADARASRDTPQLQRFAALFPLCNRRIFGQ